MLTDQIIETTFPIVQFKHALTHQTLITGGHFMIGPDNLPLLNRGTAASFRQAVELFTSAKEKGLRAKLGLLINDIGLTCESANQCSLRRSSFSKQQFKLPGLYQTILEEYCLSAQDLQLFWEKKIRNLGAELFKKWKHTKKHLIEKDETGYWLIDREMYGRILLRRESGLPTCPLIMAAFTFEQIRLGFTSGLNVYYIARENRDNIPNHFVIEKGKRVAELLGAPFNVRNVYLTDQNILVNIP